MHRIYEWIKLLFKEKVNIFIKGATGGWLLSGIFLFGSHFDSKTSFLIAYLIKVFAVTVSGVVSGFATVFGNDLYKWAKEKIIIKSTRKKVRNETKTRVKRAS